MADYDRKADYYSIWENQTIIKFATKMNQYYDVLGGEDQCRRAKESIRLKRARKDSLLKQ